MPTIYNRLETVQEQDQKKQRLAKQKGITIIRVPYWWDGKSER